MASLILAKESVVVAVADGAEAIYVDGTKVTEAVTVDLDEAYAYAANINCGVRVETVDMDWYLGAASGTPLPDEESDVLWEDEWARS